MARHAAVDLSQVVNAQYSPHDAERLTDENLASLRTDLAKHGVALSLGADATERLAELRLLYEPYLQALSRRLLMPLPSWVPSVTKRITGKAVPWDVAIQARALEHPGHAWTIIFETKHF